MATMGCRQPASAAMVSSSCSPYFFASRELLRVFPNSEMSAPAAKAWSPAPRITTQRSDASRCSPRMASPRRLHMARSSAFSFPGLSSVTVAMSLSRERRIPPGMGILGRRLAQGAARAPERAGDQRPEEEHEREGGDRADEAVRPEHAQIARRADHREAEGVLGAVAENERERERRERNSDFLEHVADDAEEEHQPDVEHGVLDRVGADRAGDDDHGGDGGERDAQHGGEERHGRKNDDQADD